MTNNHRQFYGLMGPFLASREVVKELGHPIWDEPERTWLVDVNETTVKGFCAYIERKTHTYFCSDYVVPEFRGNGIYHRMFSARLSHVKRYPIRATITKASIPTFEKFGFIATGQRGRFTMVELRP